MNRLSLNSVGSSVWGPADAYDFLVEYNLTDLPSADTADAVEGEPYFMVPFENNGFFGRRTCLQQLEENLSPDLDRHHRMALVGEKGYGSAHVPII